MIISLGVRHGTYAAALPASLAEAVPLISAAPPPQVFLQAVSQVVQVGDVYMATGNTLVLIDKPSSVTSTIVHLLPAAQGNVFEIYDWNGNAGTLILTPAGSDLVMGAATYSLTRVARLTPFSVAVGSATVTGWLAR